jgi:hypothetical protein
MLFFNFNRKASEPIAFPLQIFPANPFSCCKVSKRFIFYMYQIILFVDAELDHLPVYVKFIYLFRAGPTLMSHHKS